MPACARCEIVLEGEVGVYHCWAGCVRRAFLCGQDAQTGCNFDHRRDWVHQFCGKLAALFGVEVGFHAELSNHLHLVLRSRPDVVEIWTDEDVARRCLETSRWVRSHDGQTICPPTAGEIAMEVAKPGRIAELRKRLASISSFMGAVCEHIARRSNREDHCRGRFWEGRFGCRRLESEAAILVCGIYVDLNQIRAGETLTPEESTHTSAYDRIAGRRQYGESKRGPQRKGTEAVSADRCWLCELTLDERAEAYASPWAHGDQRVRASDKGLLPIRLEDYLELLDWTGRTVRADKSGAIPSHLSPILDRLGIHTEHWLDLVTNFEHLFRRVVGDAEQLAACATVAGRRWYQGIRPCRDAFG